MIGVDDLPEIALQASSLDGRYRLLYSIGEGRFAQVKLAVDSQTGKKVAVKIMREVCATDPKSIECFLSEVTILNQVAPCPHVVQLQRVCLGNNDSPYSRNPGPLYYVMKVAENGELFKFLLHTPKFDEPFARHFFSQLLTGLEHLHEEGFAHRDIKPENILIDKKLDLKLCDFGFATRCKSDQGLPILFDSSDPVGSPEYNAPEITQSALAGRKYEAQSADIFSAGCVLFMMVLGNAPFESSSTCDRYYSRFCLPNKASFWKIFSFSCKPSASFKDLIHGMLEPDPAIRLTLSEIKKHPWMTQEPRPSDEEVRGYMGERIKVVFEKTLEELRDVLKNKKGAPDIERDLQQGMKSLSRIQSEGLRQKYGKQVKEINQCVVRKLQHVRQQRLLLKQAQPPASSLQSNSTISSNNQYPPTNNSITPTTSIQTSINNPIIIAPPQKTISQKHPQKEPQYSPKYQSNTPFSAAMTSSKNNSNHSNSSNYSTHKISSNSPCIFEMVNSKNTSTLSNNSALHRKKRPSAGYQSDDCIQTEPLLPPVPKRQHDSAPSSMTYNDSP